MRDQQGGKGGLCETTREGEGVVLCNLRGAVQESRGVWVLCRKGHLRDFGKRFTNFLGVNHFPNFYTRFSGQRKSFVV